MFITFIIFTIFSQKQMIDLPKKIIGQISEIAPFTGRNAMLIYETRGSYGHCLIYNGSSGQISLRYCFKIFEEEAIN